ncbi:MAG: hypothetical protein JXB46_01605 [Candidatus Eisenbacteria bacterium]|nr:hypothetical protein [Candidatus Eisenbacteria bacterium]
MARSLRILIGALIAALALTSLTPLAVSGAPPTSSFGGRTSFLGSDFPGAAMEERGLRLADDGHVMDMNMDTSSAGGFERTAGSSRKNPMFALLLSCVVPGWGEIYAGETTRGRWFMASEAAVWVGYGSFKLQAKMREDDYIEYAQIYAGVEGADSDYLSDIADYVRSEGDASYNQAIRAEARSLYPDDLEAQRDYAAEHGYYGDDSWDWGSRDRFYKYRDLRGAASQSDRYAFYMTGLAFLNRAISAIDSAWMARRYNAGIDEEPSARLSVAPLFEDGEVGGRATLELSF